MSEKKELFPIPPEQALAEVLKLRDQQPDCPKCKGKGRYFWLVKEIECTDCKGTGKIETSPKCEFCKGTGKVRVSLAVNDDTELRCQECKGTGIVQPKSLEKAPIRSAKITEANIPKTNRKKITEQDTLASMFESAKSEYESLKNEIGEWRDNMDGTGLENTSKYETVETAADELESGFGEIEDVDPDTLPEKIWNIELTVSYIYPKRSAGRSWRAGEVAVKLSAIADRLNEFKDDAEAVEMASSIQSAADTIEGVEFPGMF